MDLQELITRGRFIFHGAPQRLEVFRLFNGKRSLQEIASMTNRLQPAIRRDASKIFNAGLIEQALDKEGAPLKKGKSPVYQKIALARTVNVKYFTDGTKTPERRGSSRSSGAAKTAPSARRKALAIPDEKTILDICAKGEDQLHEFKQPGTDASKLATEVAAMLNTKAGGLIFYGIDDGGKVLGSDKSSQELDQMLQNATRDTMDPAPVLQIREVTVMGSPILVIGVPPRKKQEVYLYKHQAYLRRGTNAFKARAPEIRRLHKGEFIT